jgi:ribosome maturation factor RimP
MDIVQRITTIIEPSLNAMGYTLVQVKLADGMRRKTLTVMAERQDGKGMGFDDCAEISRMASALLDVDDPITSAYDLEVCSPGLDRPLVKIEDFKRYAGQEAKAETLIPIEGRRRFRGVIGGVEDDVIVITMPEGGEARLSFNNIRTAKLIPPVPEAGHKPGKKRKH